MLQAACINCAHPECEGACGGLQVSMTNVDTRQVDRDSLFLLAQLRLAGSEEQYRVKVRNLSAGGMMAEGALTVSRGQLVQVELRNIGWVEGSVAWAQDTRFGIAFIDEIDPKRARAPVTSGGNHPLTTSHRFAQPAAPVDKEKLRKI